MDVIDAFWAATETAAHRRPHWADPALSPTRLAWAAAIGLRSDGAGLNLFTGAGFRVRLGSSNEIAALVEQLEFTTGHHVRAVTQTMAVSMGQRTTTR